MASWPVIPAAVADLGVRACRGRAPSRIGPPRPKQDSRATPSRGECACRVSHPRAVVGRHHAKLSFTEASFSQKRLLLLRRCVNSQRNVFMKETSIYSRTAERVPLRDGATGGPNKARGSFWPVPRCRAARPTPVRHGLDRAHYEERLAEFRPPRFTRGGHRRARRTLTNYS